jgi:hypothetical protein
MNGDGDALLAGPPDLSVWSPCSTRFGKIPEEIPEYAAGAGGRVRRGRVDVLAILKDTSMSKHDYCLTLCHAAQLSFRQVYSCILGRTAVRLKFRNSRSWSQEGEQDI